MACATTSAGTFLRTISFAHNATPTQPTPLTYSLTCRILTPPNLVYVPVAGTAVPIPGSVASGFTRTIDVTTSGAGDVDLEEVTVTNAEVSVSGAGSIALRMAGGRLTGELSGAADVRYSGTVSEESISRSGAADVRHTD